MVSIDPISAPVLYHSIDCKLIEIAFLCKNYCLSSTSLNCKLHLMHFPISFVSAVKTWIVKLPYIIFTEILVFIASSISFIFFPLVYLIENSDINNGDEYFLSSYDRVPPSFFKAFNQKLLFPFLEFITE